MNIDFRSEESMKYLYKYFRSFCAQDLKSVWGKSRGIDQHLY